ncbi:MAG TPA: stress-induced protein [Patescibacteria group bacterium]|nr:stress-induced protein [Patescibacteria group bacterium]
MEQQHSREPGEERNKRGLASADEETRSRVAHLGGEAVSRNREHMAAIGRKGGEKVSRDRMHMAEIGKRGGKASHKYDV